MKSEIEIANQIEAYFKGELSPDESSAFERLRREDSSFDHKVVSHQHFMQLLSEYGGRKKLNDDLNAVHATIDVEALKEELFPRQPMVKILWRKYRMNAAVAASVAVIVAFGTLFATGYFSKNIHSNYNALRREVSREINSQVKRSQNAIMAGIKAHEPKDPAQYGGTGFAITSNGYVVTSDHVINGADSVYIQNMDGESFKVATVYSDPVSDIAVLKITDANFKTLKPLPYKILKSTSDIGEGVYTIGFPGEAPVYGKGYISSEFGYKGDTTSYQVSIPVNNGNSGGPLLDNKGNVIGVIKGKQANAEGAAFAVKSGYLLKALATIPSDSLRSSRYQGKKNGLAGLSNADQFKKLQDFTFIVKVY